MPVTQRVVSTISGGVAGYDETSARTSSGVRVYP